VVWLSELYELIKKDLEEVVEEEVRTLSSLIDCPKARVAEDTVYFEFRLDPPNPSSLPASPPVSLPRLPVMVVYYPKAYVTVLEFKVEFMLDKDTTLAMAIVRYYFITFTPTSACFKDYFIIYANIEDIARIIAGGGGEWAG
jgi:hypothetical protein